MKLFNTYNTKRKSGMTLLELTVVILVLLSLISILFVGARAWKKGSDRSANILNLRNAQQAMRGHENMRQDTTINTFELADLEEYMKEPVSPVPSLFTYDTSGTAITGIGTLWLKTSDPIGSPGGDYGPTAASVSDW